MCLQHQPAYRATAKHYSQHAVDQGVVQGVAQGSMSNTAAARMTYPESLDPQRPEHDSNYAKVIQQQDQHACSVHTVRTVCTQCAYSTPGVCDSNYEQS